MNIKKRIKSLDPKCVRIIDVISRLADKNGIAAYLVGGFVRDILLKIKNFDIDIIVEKNGIDFAKLLARQLKGKLITHSRFGTAVVDLGDFKIDIATFRKEVYPYPGSLPIVSSGSLLEDLGRRDFSINALAASIQAQDFGEVLDYFRSLDDLRLKKLRILHKDSFCDDPTRILRLVRFKARFGFSIELETKKSLREARKRKVLEKIERHRIRDELILIFKEARPEEVIDYLANLYGLQFIHKTLRPKIKQMRDSFVGLRKTKRWYEANFPKRRQLDVWLMYFIVFLSRLSLAQIKNVGRGLGLRRGELERLISYKSRLNKLSAQLMVPKLTPSKIYSLLNPLSYEVILILLSKTKNKRVSNYIMAYLKDYNLINLKLGGDDLKRLGLEPGPRFKRLLKKVFDKKLNSKFLDKRQELEFLKKLLKK